MPTRAENARRRRLLQAQQDPLSQYQLGFDDLLIDFMFGGDTRQEMYLRGLGEADIQYEEPPIEPGFFGLDVMAGAGAMGARYAPKLADEAIRMMTLGEVGLGDVARSAISGSPSMINKLERRLGMPETPFELKMFAGERAAGDDMLDLAKELDDAGMTREHIYNATGWFKGPDNKWRVEKADDLTALQPRADVEAGMAPDWQDFSSAYDYPPMTELYPTLTDRTVVSYPEGTASYFAGPTRRNPYNQMGIGRAAEKPYENIVGHEMQHGVQFDEGFTQGASPEFYSHYVGKAQREPRELLAQLDDALDEKNRLMDAVRESGEPDAREILLQLQREQAEMMADRAEMIRAFGLNHTPEEHGFSMYYRTAGEVEARNVENRLHMTPDERRMAPPWTTQDIPDMDQVLFEDYMPGGSMSGKLARDIDEMEAEELFRQSKARGEGSSANVGKTKTRVGTTGKYVGAPEDITTPQALGRLRKNYMETAKLGSAGRDWYDDSSDWIQTVVPDTIRGKQIADTLGVTSQGTNVDTNLGFTVKALTQNIAGKPVKTGRFPGNQSPLIEEILAGHNPDLGPKRTPFAENLTASWNPFLQDRPVHDIWQGRAMGYKTKSGKPWEGGFSPQQHAFMDEQMDWINAKLNAEAAEGFTDWNNLKTQAAAWTGAKIKSGDLSIDDAAKHFGSFSPKYQMNATSEQIPGAGTGHLEGMAARPAATRQEFSDMVSWMDQQNRDMLYSDIGMMTSPSDTAQGVFKAPSGATEFNPAQVAHPLGVMAEVEKGVQMVTPETRAILNAVEGTRAYVDVQNAGAWHKLIAKNKAQSNSSLSIPLERQATEDEMRAIADLAERNGMFAVDTGKGINLINDPYTEIGKNRTGTTLLKELKKGLSEQLQAIVPEARSAYRVTADTGYINYADAWAAGEGSGEATRRLQKLFNENPEILNRLDQSESLRRKAMEKIDRDAKMAAREKLPIREDLQTARRIIAESGLKGLFRALDQGVALPAVALSLIPLLTEGEGENN